MGNIAEITNNILTDTGIVPSSIPIKSGTPVANQLTYWNGVSTIAPATSLTWDNATSRLGVGVTGTSWISVAAGTATKAQLNFATSVNPTTPNNGDVWATATDLFARINGVTYSLISGGISGTTNEIAYFTTASSVGSLPVATYPSLTELSYVKGLTSAVQTQINAKQNTLSLTTTGTSGVATLVGATLNIPQYTPSWGAITGTLSSQTDLQSALSGKFNNPTGTTAQYLRGDGSLATFPTITNGTVTSVGMTVPSAFSVTPSTITTSGTFAITATGTTAQYVRGDGSVATFPSFLANPMNTLGDIIYGGAAGAATRLAGNTTTAKQFLSSTGSAGVATAPIWSAIAGTDVTGAAITTTNDTNILITASGNNTTALLRTMTLTAGWTGQLSVARGGTGAATLTGVVIGNAASAMTAVAGTANQLLRRDATNAFYEFFTPNYLTSANVIGAAPIVWTSATNTISIPVATSVADGYLSAADWTTFNSKQNAISLTTTGNSGAATFISNVLNVPNYTLTGLGGVPTTRTLTINGTALDLSANRSWTVGTVTGSGTAGYIPKLTTTTNIGNSLVYDNGTQVIVNSNALQGGYTHPFQIAGNAAGGMIIRTAEGTSSIGFVNSGSADKTWDISPFGNTLSINESGVTTHTPMVFHPGGNISIGVATNNAFGKLQVAGNLHVVDSYIRTGTATATNGTVLLTSSYTNGDISTIGTNGSGGGISIGYTVKPATTGVVDAYVSSTTATASKAVFIVDGTQKWLMGASSSTPVGTAVSLTKMMELYETGNLIIQNGGTYADDGVNKLQVTGSIKVTTNSTISGLSVGKGAGNIATNTAVGASALITNSSGAQNTAVGNDALRLNTAGLQNSAFGYRSSRATTTGSTNSAFGIDTLRVNTTGSNNAAFGAQALDNNTAGNNTAIGTGALLDNTSGGSNTALGYRAGYAGIATANSTGSNNIFIGSDSIGEAASDSNRTFVGNTSTTSTWLGGNLLLGTRTNTGQRLQVIGRGIVNNSITQVEFPTFTDNRIGLFGAQTINVPTTASFSDGSVNSALTGAQYLTFNGNTSVNGDALFAGSVHINSVQFATTGTVTMNASGTGGQRTMSVMQLQMQKAGTIGGTINRGSTLYLFGVYPTTSTGGTVTFTEYAGLRIGNLTEWATASPANTTVALTNKWGIYQEGVSDPNYFAGAVGVGISTPTPTAKLQVDSTTQGFLPPRMTNAQMTGIVSPAAGLIVYNTTDNKHYGYNGTTWNAFY